MICAAQKHCTKVPYYRPRCGPPGPMSRFFSRVAMSSGILNPKQFPQAVRREYICEQPVFVEKSKRPDSARKHRHY